MNVINRADFNFLLKFLWFCSGANIKVLKKCQIDQGKYAAIGFTILFTSVLTSLSRGHALWTLFNSSQMATGFGLFWGLMIGNLDRFLVSTTWKEEKWSIEQKANQDLHQVLDQWSEKQKENAYNAVVREAEGISGTKKLGKGPVYDMKWQKYHQNFEEYQSYFHNLQRIELLTQKRDAELQKIVNERQKADDIMTQLETLDELGKKKHIYAWSSFFITLFFVLNDVGPIIAKLLLKRSLYDQVLELEEQTQHLIAKESSKLEEDTHLTAITGVNNHEEYAKAIDELTALYTSKVSDEVSRLGKEFDPTLYKKEIKKAINKNVQNQVIPHSVSKEKNRQEIEQKIYFLFGTMVNFWENKLKNLNLELSLE